MWNPCGTDLFHVESTWNPHGIHMESTWNPHGIHMESTWNMFHHINHVLNVDSMQNPHGIHMESTWTYSTWNPHGIHMKSMWIPCGMYLIFSTYSQVRFKILISFDQLITS